MKYYYSLILCLFFSSLFSQVGIGTTSPNATFDIVANNQITPANTDGFLLPRIDTFPATNPTVAQNGMLVYLTTTVGSNVPGFYYWNNSSTSWESMSNDSNWVTVGANIERQSGDIYIGNINTTNNDLYISDRIIDWDTISYYLDPDNISKVNEIEFDSGSVSDPSIRFGSANTGFFSPSINAMAYSTAGMEVFRIQNDGEISIGTTTASAYDINMINSFGNKSISLGVNNINSNPVLSTFISGDTAQNTIEANVNSGNSGFPHSVIKAFNNIGNITVNVARNESGSLKTYGIKSVLTGNLTGPKYGIYSESLQTNAFAGYFLGNVYIGTTTVNGYKLPVTDGTVNQTLKTDGAGQLSWVSNTSGASKIDNLLDGKSDADGSNNGSSVFLGVNAGATDDSSNNKNVGIGYESLKMNTIGGANTAIGYGSLLSNTTGVANSAMGHYALKSNQTGNNNIGIGISSLSDLVSGSYNTAIGGQSIPNLTGSNNVAIGYRSGAADVSSSRNVYIGDNAGSGDTTSGFTPEDKTGNIFIGYYAGYNENGNNRLVIENSNSSSPLIYGEFDTNILKINGELQVNDPTSTGYKLPSADGIFNQVLTTDGNGQTSWQAPSAPTGVVPVGSIIAWYGTVAGVALSSEWQLCDGSVISDVDSPMNGQNTPNLNGNTTSISGKSSEGRFLRGSTTSGVLQGDQSNHLNTVELENTSGGATLSITLEENGFPRYVQSDVYNSVSNRYKMSLKGQETRPTNMSVIWIMRIK